MKILFLHTYYTQKGGEEAVFGQERELLAHSEQVSVVEYANKGGWRGALQFLSSAWNTRAARKLKKAIREHRPDVLHIHNWHFAIGPIAVRTARKAGIPVVMTLHNYRLLCPSATLLHDGKLFTDSLQRSFPWGAVRRKLYRNSRLQTFWLATIVWLHKKLGTWKMVDQYIALTDFSKDVFAGSPLGVPPEKFTVKPNFVYAGESNPPVERKDHFLFIGRLHEEKGIRTLIEAFRGSDRLLHIAGNGRLKDEVLAACAEHKNITYLGELNTEEVRQQMRECTALIFPSIWYEGMPITLLEAFATGTPVLASKLGAMSSMISDGYNGLFFEAGNAAALRQVIERWSSLSAAEKNAFGLHASQTYLDRYTPQKNKALLLGIYNNVSKAGRQ